MKKNVFISYSHKDKKYLEKLQPYLKPFEKAGLIDLWVDTKIKSAQQWEDEIRAALERANIAILLISADFLASDFIVENELPPLLSAAKLKGTEILPIILRPCGFSSNKNLSKFQTINGGRKPLSGLELPKREEIYQEIAERIRQLSEKEEEIINTKQLKYDVGDIQFASKEFDKSITRSNILQNDEDFIFLINANEIWEVVGELEVSCNSTMPDIRIAFTIPSESIMKLHAVGILTSRNSIMGSELLTNSGVAKRIDIGREPTNISIRGLIISKNSPGVIQFKWSQDNPSAANPITVRANSYIKMTRVK